MQEGNSNSNRLQEAEYSYQGNPSEECLKGFSQRIRNMAPFVCLIRKLGNLQKYPDYDMFSIGFGVMLFVLENMLIGREECSIDEISEFLQSLVYRIYRNYIPQEDARELAFYIRDAVAGSGESYEFSYMDLERGLEDKIPVKLMEVSYYEIKKTSRYKLTDQGMELLFKTREIFSEFRINITQLYLRQQIERGVFVGALQTVNELNLQVRQLRERMEGLLERIRQNVFGVDFNELKVLFEKIREQFQAERREFTTIKHILGEQKRNIEEIDLKNLMQKDVKALRQIKVIGERLNLVSMEHDRLFNEKLDIIGEYVRMLEFRMKTGITEYLDYEREIFDRLGKENHTVDTVRKILSPLFANGDRHKVFNPFKAFAPQRIRSEEDTPAESIDFSIEMERREKEYMEAAERRNLRIESYFETILSSVLRDGETTLGRIIGGFDEDTYRQASSDFDFFSLIVMLHQRKEMNMEELAGIAQSLVYDSAFNIDLDFIAARVLEKNPGLQKLRRFAIISTNKTFGFDNGNMVTDFTVMKV